jgi:hypothetical protein
VRCTGLLTRFTQLYRRGLAADPSYRPWERR